MRLMEITDKNRLNDFLSAQGGSFLQSWEWGEFQEKSGFGIRRFGLMEDGEMVAVATVVEKGLTLGVRYWYCPRGVAAKAQGPRTNDQERHKTQEPKNIFNYFFSEIKKLAKKENIVFLRFEPAFDFQLSTSNFQLARTRDVQPSKTIILDLTKSETELLSAMHSKTRYNIKLAEKKGVEISSGKKYFDEFWRLMNETKTRDNFRLHDRDYYQAMLVLDFIKLYVAKHQGQVIAANIVAMFNDTATYVHGASGNEGRNLMAPYLLQWQAIKDAKAVGCARYDFYGIDERKWPGVTRFKAGFGGEEIIYPGTFDLVVRKGYYSVYKLIRKIRSLR